mmetsp:Transcript_2368/g.1699  ORF Transcript_2368/g.1699 Transcript_2368/m.1699 type:complete len:399 (+) Transcript_2368:54-1250(+)
MLASIILVAFVTVSFGAKVPLTMLSDPKAKCLDGTQAGYYAQSASNPVNKNKWVIYLNGGGECDTYDACWYQTSNALGSSKYFSSEVDASGWFLGSDYCTYNPTFCEWNHVYDPYCTQDLHAGQVTEVNDENFGLYFAGHHVFTAMLDALDKPTSDRASMLDAEEIILTGASAGGIGVWMNLDYLAHRYPKAKVSGMTIAGHYFYATYYDGPNHTNPGGMGDFRESAWSNTYKLYNAYVDESCKAAYERRGESAGACLLSNNSLPFIESDVFVVQAKTDSVVLTGHDCWPESNMYDEPEQAFMQQWSQNMSIALEPLMKLEEEKVLKNGPRRGVFAVSCYTHTGFNHAYPLLNGQNFYSVFSKFYFNNNALYNSTIASSEYKLQDTCGLMCNPTCSGR